MTKSILLLLLFTVEGSLSYAQNVGIGTATPHESALLHVDAGSNRGIIATGTYNAAFTFPNLGAGSRMMFYPGRDAFRAGSVSGAQWDNANVGRGSFATGSNTIASNSFSTAMGYKAVASGYASVAMGEETIASGFSSTAMGSATLASDYGATAMGYETTASGNSSTAMGYQTIASGFSSVAMGFQTTANGVSSTAMGSKVSTNNQRGGFVIGDSDPNNQGVAMPGLPDLFVARFNNGYYLYTSGVTTNIGVALNHNSNAWVSICDENRKENFEPLNGEDVLQKISKLNLTSWNYKQQDPSIYRHYGVMAQDFYKAFGKDKYGTIGNDTTVNPVDMLGIDMAAIQALEKRTVALSAENKKLKGEVEELKTALQKEREAITKRLQQLEAIVLQQNNRNQLVVNQ